MTNQNSINQNIVNNSIETQSATPFNTAVGFGALSSTLGAATGANNTAVGFFASQGTSSGFSNTAVGSQALLGVTTGAANVAVGYQSLNQVITGSNNVALGTSAGSAYLGSESNNVLIGQGVTGTIGESNVTRIANVRGTDQTNKNATLATVDSSGQLGSVQIYSVTGDVTSYTIGTNNEWILEIANTSAQAVTVNLPTPSPSLIGRTFTIKDTGGAAFNNIITLSPPAGTTIDGASTATINTNYGALTVYTDGAQYYSQSLSNTTTGLNLFAATQTTSPFTTYLGYGSLGNGGSTGVNNTAIGYSTLQSTTTGSNNTGVGYQVLNHNVVGVNNTAIGSLSLTVNLGNGNTAVGNSALTGNTTGGSNTAVGNLALSSVATSSGNTAVGSSALLKNTASSNTAVGTLALGANTTGTFNTAVGSFALATNTTAGNNTAVGASALTANTTGVNNAAFGSTALTANTTGGNNTAFGSTALTANTNGSNNTAVGSAALVANTTGIANTALGYNAGLKVTTGTGNTILGAASLNALTTGSNNSVLGSLSLTALPSGSNNVVLGGNSGNNYTGSETNNILIGAAITGTAGESNVTRIGNTSTAAVYFTGVAGVATANTNLVTINTATGQLGSAASGTVWSSISTSQTLAVSHGYIVSSGALSLALPATSVVGNTIEVVLAGGTSWTITQAPGQQITYNGTTTTSGATGNLTSSTVGASVRLVCTTANTFWTVVSSVGTITVH